MDIQKIKLEAIEEFYRNLESVFNNDLWIDMNAFGGIEVALSKTLNNIGLDGNTLNRI